MKMKMKIKAPFLITYVMNGKKYYFDSVIAKQISKTKIYKKAIDFLDNNDNVSSVIFTPFVKINEEIKSTYFLPKQLNELNNTIKKYENEK